MAISPEWQSQEIGELIENYTNQFQENSDDFIQKIKFTHEYKNNLAGVLFRDFTEKSSNMSITIDVEDKLYEANTYLNTHNLNTIDGIEIYSSKNNKIIENGNFKTKTSYHSAFCGDKKININANIQLTGEDIINEKKYFELLEIFTNDFFINTLKLSTICEINEKLSIKITKTQGEVEIKKGDENFKPAKIGDVLNLGDYIATGFESSAEFEIIELGIRLSIKENTNFSVKQLFYDKNIARTGINLSKGKVDTIFKHEKGVKASFQIITPTVTVGVRGTEFLTTVNGESGATDVYVYEGKIELETEKETKYLEENQKAYIGKAGIIEITNMDEDMVKNESSSQNNFLIISIFFIIALIFAIVLIIKKKIATGIIILIISSLLSILSYAYLLGTFDSFKDLQPIETEYLENSDNKKYDTEKNILENSENLNDNKAQLSETLNSDDSENPKALNDNNAQSSEILNSQNQDSLETNNNSENPNIFKDNSQITDLNRENNKNTPTYSPDNSFTINLAPHSEKIIFIETPNDWSEKNYTACYQINDPNYEDGNCNKGTEAVFSIALYSPDSMEEINNSPVYEDTFIELYQFADGAAWILEWPNGILPEEIKDIDQNYFTEISKTFMLQFGN